METGSKTHIILVSNDNRDFRLSLSALDQEDCGYIRGLLRSGMRECNQHRVQLPVVSGCNLQTAVDFLHGETPSLNMETIDGLLEAATYLQIPRLVEICGQFLEENMNPENILDVISIGEQFSMQDCVDKARDYLHRSIALFSDTTCFLEMEPGDVTRLLATDDLEVKEIYVFRAVIKWLQREKDKRLAEVRDILDVVRFPLLTGDDLKEASATLQELSPLAQYMKEKVEEAKRFHEDPYLVHEKGSVSTRPRRTVQSVLALGGFTGKEHSTNRFQQWPLDRLDSPDQVLDFHSGRSEKLPTSLCEHSACVLDNFLYVAGGQTQYCQDGRYTSNTVYRYDPRFSTWLQVCPMQTPRSLFHLDVLQQQMYAVAGWRAPNSVSRSVERYTPRQNKWDYVASLDIGLHEHAGCSNSSHLYISGGYKGPARGHLDRAWRFDPALNEWETLAPMLQARSYHAMVALGDEHLLVLGGVNQIGGDVFEDVQSCELYDIPSSQWTVVTHVPRPASCMGHFQHGDRILLLGGHSFVHHTDHSDVQVLDVKAMTWTSMTMTSNKILHFPALKMQLPALLARAFVK